MYLLFRIPVLTMYEKVNNNEQEQLGPGFLRQSFTDIFSLAITFFSHFFCLLQCLGYSCMVIYLFIICNRAMWYLIWNQTQECYTLPSRYQKRSTSCLHAWLRETNTLRIKGQMLYAMYWSGFLYLPLTH